MNIAIIGLGWVGKAMEQLKRVNFFNGLIKLFSFNHYFRWYNFISYTFTFSKFKNKTSFWSFNFKVWINLFYNRYCQFVCNIPRPITTFTKFRGFMPVGFTYLESFYQQIYHGFVGSCNRYSFIVTGVDTPSLASRTHGRKMFFNTNISFSINNPGKVSKIFFSIHIQPLYKGET